MKSINKRINGKQSITRKSHKLKVFGALVLGGSLSMIKLPRRRCSHKIAGSTSLTHTTFRIKAAPKWRAGCHILVIHEIKHVIKS